MDPSIAVAAKCELRAVIRFLNVQKVQPIEIHRQLTNVYGDKCMSIQHVRKWCREFSEGRSDVHDEPRSGRPSSSDDVVAKVQWILLEDRQLVSHPPRTNLVVSQGFGYNSVNRGFGDVWNPKSQFRFRSLYSPIFQQNPLNFRHAIV